MIEKVKLNEVAKDLNINGKELTTLPKSRRRYFPAMN